MPRVTEAYVARLEAGSTVRRRKINELSSLAAPRHSCGCTGRGTVARRAERRGSRYQRSPVSEDVMRYMNRLSSLLYQMAVWCQKRARGKAEHPSYRR